MVWRSALVKALTGLEDETRKLIVLVGFETHSRLVSCLRRVASGVGSQLESW